MKWHSKAAHHVHPEKYANRDENPRRRCTVIAAFNCQTSAFSCNTTFSNHLTHDSPGQCCKTSQNAIMFPTLPATWTMVNSTATLLRHRTYRQHIWMQPPWQEMNDTVVKRIHNLQLNETTSTLKPYAVYTHKRTARDV